MNRPAKVSPFLLLVFCSFFASAAMGGDLFFSEYIEGSSNNKALEIYNPADGAIDLGAGGYSVQMFFNGSSSAGLTINLSGTVAQGGVFVLAQSSAAPEILAQADQTSGAGWFNGDDAVVLRKGATIIDSLGQIGFDPGTEWGSGLTSTADNTLRRTTCAGDSNANDPFDPSLEWEGFATNTFDGLGAHSCEGTPPPPPPTPTDAEIFVIQGSGLTSPLVGQLVRTSANIVTAVDSNGFFIQTPDARTDADAETSDGIFVFTSTPPLVAVGDMVNVTGRVSEFFDFTEIGDTPLVDLLSSGNPLPSVVTLNPAAPSPDQPQPVNELERFEGMLVRLTGGIATAGSDQFGDVKIAATASRPFREPGIEYPGLPGLPVWDGNPEIFEMDPDALGLPSIQIFGGSSIDLIEGPLSFAFGDYQIWPTILQLTPPAEFPRAARVAASGEFRVGSQNMLRLFNDIDDPGISEPVTNASVYQSRLDKLSLQVREVLGAPEVLAVEEVENLSTLTDLATKIEFDDPSIHYSAYLIEGNDIGGIDVGFLVRDTIRVDSVTQFGQSILFDFDGSLLFDRPPLVLEGAYIGNGQPFPFTAIAVHQRSLSGIEGSGGERVRLKRQAGALELAHFIQMLQQDNSDMRLVVIGDFNAFEFTDGYADVMGIITGSCDPLGALLECLDEVDPNLTNQVLAVAASDRYSYVEGGSAQVLDHALTSHPLDRFVRGLEYGRSNADAPVVFENDPLTALRSSDHDGLVLYVMSDFDGDGVADDADACARGSAEPTVIIDGCDSGVANPVALSGCSLTDAFLALAADASSHGDFVSAVSHLTNDLKAEGRLTGAEKSAIVSCAATSSLP